MMNWAVLVFCLIWRAELMSWKMRGLKLLWIVEPDKPNFITYWNPHFNLKVMCRFTNILVRALANNFLSFCNKSCNNWDLLNYCNNFTCNNEFQVIAIKSLRNNFAIIYGGNFETSKLVLVIDSLQRGPFSAHFE